jgi:phage N-6-adenine-methyltransferase
MKFNAGLCTSNTYEWETPQALFDPLHKEFQFTLDVCATPENAKCENFYHVANDALKHEWVGTCWMNPPYGREIGKWVQKAKESATAGATVVCLVPARTCSAWWHDHAAKASEIRFIRGRVKFGGAKWNAPFPSVILVFKPKVVASL